MFNIAGESIHLPGNDTCLVEASKFLYSEKLFENS